MLKYVEKRFGVDTDSHDAADAVTLNFIGQALVGWWYTELGFQEEILDAIKLSYSAGARGKVKKARRKTAEFVAA